MSDSLSSMAGSQLSLSRVRSSRIPSVEDNSSSRRKSPTLSTSTSAPIPGLQDIVRILQSSGLPGPSIAIGPFEYIGQGGQFVVHRGELINVNIDSCETSYVAIKNPKFNIDPSERLKLTDRSAQQHLKNISLEIRALTTPALHRHPNITQLLSWAYDSYSVHQQPQLVMELASSDLQKFLKKKGEELPYQQRYSFCADIASGLDVIHKCELVHGDLKPGNILIFANSNRPIAKPADFGLSVGELDSAEASIRLGGTPGWQAPEVEQNKPLMRHEILKTDIYSFGLVVWTTLLASGEPPQGSNAAERRTWVMEQLKKAETYLTGTLKTNIILLLEEEPAKRPDKVEELFRPNEEAGAFGYRAESQDESSIGMKHSEVDLSLRPFNHISEGHDIGRLSWELYPLHAFEGDLLPRYMKNMNTAPGDFLFSYYLHFNSLECGAEFREPRGFLLLDVLVAAAKQGYRPAQAVILDVFDFYDKALPDEANDDLVTYLRNAVSTGSTFARRHLESRDPMAFSTSIRCFKSSGGYGSFYCKKAQHSQLHSITTSGTAVQLQNYLSSTPGIDIDQKTIDGESPLYLACARGSWDIVTELLDRGASASGDYSKYHITCLHWIFAFDPSVQCKAITRLIQNGADINAKASQPLPFFHYPFELPAGTPLHWAIVTRSHKAVQTLVENGAGLNVRDGSDPYRYDHRVRILGAFGSLNQDTYSFSETGTQGLSPMDYAAMSHDPSLFEFLLQFKEIVRINNADEEGFSVLHRLSSTVIKRTRSAIRFFPLHFQDSLIELRAQLLMRTVQAIKSLGGDIEQFSTPNVNVAQAQQNRIMRELDWKGYTPLMLAALGGRPDVVNALLLGGADVNKENEAGATALHCISEEKHAAVEVCRILISQGAVVNHKDKAGITPLQKAALVRNLELLGMVLSHGADIEEIGMDRTSVLSGSSVLAHLAHTIYDQDIFNETYDKNVGNLIDKSLLNVDDEKRRRIVTRCDPGHGTLLDSFAGCLMRHTVPVLIRHGADVNAISQNYTRCFKARKAFKVMPQKTPLDTAIKSKEMEIQRMNTYRHRTFREHDRILERADAVIKAIKDAGGTTSTEPEITIPVPPEVSTLRGYRGEEAMRDLKAL
ncbi:hypothetical protein F4779DRAFT_636688 [Xylariaceae sp. FL0662B]|nr:hypothetical protein F4779DRAFT_636688 [Xylariaceae sp. FL0662B]